MVCQRSNAPWQIIDKKKKKEVKIKTTSIQSGFVAVKGSVPVKSRKKQKLAKAENLSVHANKKTKKGDTEVKDDVTEVQVRFVAAEGSIPVNSSKKRKIEDGDNLSASTKKTKTAQMIQCVAYHSAVARIVFLSFRWL